MARSIKECGENVKCFLDYKKGKKIVENNKFDVILNPEQRERV
jgi:hypothetical protein